MEPATPTRTPSSKTPRKAAVKSTTGIRRFSENFDPNLPAPTPTKKPISSSPAASKSVKRPPPRAPPQPPTAAAPVAAVGRKFIIAKKKTGVKQGGGVCRDVGSCRQAAYKALRASHEDFFKIKDMGCSGSSSVLGPNKGTTGFSAAEEEEEGKEHSRNSCGGDDGKEDGFPAKEEEDDEEEGMVELQGLEGSSKVRKMRSIMLDEARRSIPEAGRVMHLVKAFESILSISKVEGSGRTVDESKRKVVMNWPLPGIQPPPPPPPKAVLSSSSFCSSAEFFFPSKDFQLDSRLYSSTDSSNWRLSCGSRTSSRGTSRRNSSDYWSKKLKVTSQHPFKLRTEQRGRLKEEHFLRKVKEMIMEEEKLRIPVAQGLPWTTDEPECLMKPSIKEATQPVDLILHSDVRAMERAEFDQYMELRVTLAEQRKLEIERQQRLEEEERTKQKRKELVPRAQPMPYFDRPFVPKKSTRPRTVPKEPRFHMQHVHKKCVPGDIREILKNK